MGSLKESLTSSSSDLQNGMTQNDPDNLSVQLTRRRPKIRGGAGRTALGMAGGGGARRPALVRGEVKSCSGPKQGGYTYRLLRWGWVSGTPSAFGDGAHGL